MPVVTAPMTGRTVGATTSFAVKNQTSGAGGKPVLPVFARAGLNHKKKKRKHHSESFMRHGLRLIETDDRPPSGLEGDEPRLGRETDKSTRLARAGDLRVQRAMGKANLPWPGAKQKQFGGKVIEVPHTGPGWKPSKAITKLSDVHKKLGLGARQQ